MVRAVLSLSLVLLLEVFVQVVYPAICFSALSALDRGFCWKSLVDSVRSVVSVWSSRVSPVPLSLRVHPGVDVMLSRVELRMLSSQGWISVSDAQLCCS